MDVLYEDLENYEDENIIQELRRENGELKYKLEEYTSAMDKLQKEFDKLSSEFKKLEMNYSSLLKTAKEEIQRKTLIITNLNTEKDMMVLNSIDNRNMLRYKRGNKANASNRFVKDAEKSKYIEDSDDKRGLERSSEETQHRTENIKKSAMKYADSINTRSNETKENKKDQYKDDMVTSRAVSPKASSIRNRRKSMPSTRVQAKFSSDEEPDDYGNNGIKSGISYKKNIQESKTLTNNDKPYRDKGRQLDDRYRMSETSSLDDKYIAYQENRYYKSRAGKYNDKVKDRYDIPRYSRYMSPDRSRRSSRYYYDEHSTRSRVLDSPPREKYYSHIRRDKNYDLRNKIDRTESYEYENDRDKYYDKSRSYKHKLASENDEPTNKRRRNDSLTHYIEEDKRSETHRYPAAPPMAIAAEHISCQSPDYISQDISAVPPIKEIKNTCATQLDDPRLHSTKYFVHSTNDDVLISTIVGRNIDLKLVDKSKWNTQHMDLPKALTRRPSQCSEDPSTEDVTEHPHSNISVESGELSCETNEANKNLFDIERADEDNLKHVALSEPKDSVSEVRPDTKKDLKSSNYKIPKLDKNNKLSSIKIKHTESKKDNNNKVIDTNKLIPLANVDVDEDFNDDQICDTDIPEHNQYSVLNEVSEITDLNVLTKDQTHATENLDTVCSESNKSVLPSPTQIEEDLHLSDETSDYADVQNTQVLNGSDINYLKCAQSLNKIETTSSEKPVEDEVQKIKSKKKAPKTITPCLESNKLTDQVQEKKPRKKKDVIDIKKKFSELFGETSSSLITPEDLGLSAIHTQNALKSPRIPMCEDAQDAVDINVIRSIENSTSCSELKSDEAKEIENVITNIEIPNLVTKRKESDNRKRKSKKNEIQEVAILNNNNEKNSSSAKHDLMTSETKNKHSSFIDDNKESNNKRTDLALQAKTMAKEMSLPNTETLSALATSTPHKDNNRKELTSLTEIESSSDRYILNNDTAPNVESSTILTEQSSNNTFGPRTEIDTPDVRIFLKRRKIKKKSMPLC